jgi:FMN-dependent NADH-azoreductase
MKLLHVDSSPLGTASVTRELTAAIVAAYRRADPRLQVTTRDVGATPPDHLTGELMQVVKFRDLENLNARQRAELELTDRLVDEVLDADLIVIGAPMYNFSVPTQLKAWLDRIAQAGRTFRYTEKGPEGLAGGKTVIVVSTRGGQYAGVPAMEAMEHQESYLKAMFGFFGITDVRIVRAEGLAMGADARAKAMAEADRAIAAHTAEAANQPRAALRA